MEHLISVENVSYSYVTEGEEPTVGVKNVSLDIDKGEFVVFLGHNGSGKSTLAKLLNGFLIPDEGTVLVDGIDTKDEKKSFDVRRRVGMVFQNPDNQMVASIIEDDIAFGCENLGVERKEIIERVDWALKAVNMEEYRNHTPHKLSGGQKQRIAIAAILAMRPGTLILDESTAMLDPVGRKEVLAVVHELNRQGMTVILITHYMEEAVECDRVFLMSGGEIIGRGTPREVFAREELVHRGKVELPCAAIVAKNLQSAGFDVGDCLTAEELVEAVCRLK